jgi:hypothetical protein
MPGQILGSGRGGVVSIYCAQGPAVWSSVAGFATVLSVQNFIRSAGVVSVGLNFRGIEFCSDITPGTRITCRFWHEIVEQLPHKAWEKFTRQRCSLYSQINAGVIWAASPNARGGLRGKRLSYTQR